MASIGQYDEAQAPDHTHSEGGALMPEGDYVGQIIDSDVIDNKAQNGKVLKLKWELLNDGYKGRQVHQNINIQHTGSTEAHRIGQKEFANLKDVIGIPVGQKVGDTLMLHNKPAGLRLKVELGSQKPNSAEFYKDKNQVASFFNANDFGSEARGPGVAAGAPAPYQAPANAPAAANAPAPAPRAAAPAPAPAAAVTPPWLKKTG